MRKELMHYKIIVNNISQNAYIFLEKCFTPLAEKLIPIPFKLFHNKKIISYEAHIISNDSRSYCHYHELQSAKDINFNKQSKL
jgi:hypothetical protein